MITTVGLSSARPQKTRPRPIASLSFRGFGSGDGSASTNRERAGTPLRTHPPLIFNCSLVYSKQVRFHPVYNPPEDRYQFYPRRYGRPTLSRKTPDGFRPVWGTGGQPRIHFGIVYFSQKPEGRGTTA